MNGLAERVVKFFLKLHPYHFILITFFLASCGPSYPKEKVAESLQALCQQEYKIAVQAQVAQTTIGILVTIPDLLSELMKQASEQGSPPTPVLVDGQYQEEGFHFQFVTRGPFIHVDKRQESSAPTRREEDRSEAITRLDHVSTALRRVALSTDAPLEFYVLIARDPGPANLDIVFSGHLDDLKRVQYLDISLGELQRRSRVVLRHQPEILARKTVQSFLQDLSQRPLPQLLSRYAASSKQFRELFPRVVELAVLLQGRGKELSEGGDWAVRQTGPFVALVYVPMKSIGLSGALLFSIQLQEGEGTILEIERLEEAVLPTRVQDLGPLQTWKDAFYLEPMQLPEFLTDQIAKRVSAEFQPFDPEAPKGKAEETKPAQEKDVTRALMETSAYVLYSYRFTGFQELQVIDAAKGTRWTVPASQLPVYRRRNAPDPRPLP